MVLLFAVSIALANVVPDRLALPLANVSWSAVKVSEEPVSKDRVSMVFAFILISACEPSPV